MTVVPMPNLTTFYFKDDGSVLHTMSLPFDVCKMDGCCQEFGDTAHYLNLSNHVE
jgi:hypothetical protein